MTTPPLGGFSLPRLIYSTFRTILLPYTHEISRNAYSIALITILLYSAKGYEKYCVYKNGVRPHFLFMLSLHILRGW